MKTTKHTKQVGAVSDRGLIKWQGMLLTEHVRLNRVFYEEQDQVPNDYCGEKSHQLRNRKPQVELFFFGIELKTITMLL